ncbi:MAG TPA: protein kinase [Polyangiaceae bacterium]|nr:protein kinase [Polyangiaceae bacterium]
MSAPVQKGDILAGKYRIDDILGVGGMGVVVAAYHVELDERVAIKFLLPAALSNQDAVARFAREARAAVKIKSEHVARVSDVGKLDNGAPYMVMEFLDGYDLSRWLASQGPLPVQQAVDFVLQACEAIAEAHSLGIVHRDLKPANLFIIRRPDGALSVKVLDFGISKTTGIGGPSGEGGMTKTAALMGSPLYMSPEQLTTPKDVDARSDIWAIGVILYELITGATPFVADSLPELALKIVSSPPEALRNKLLDAPDGLEAVLLKCVDKDRGKRFLTVGELALALLPFGPKTARASVARISGVMHAAGYSGTALALPPSSDQRAETSAAASWGRTTTGKRRGSLPVLAGLGLLVAVVAVALALWGPVSRQPESASSSTASGMIAAVPGPSPAQLVPSAPTTAEPLPAAGPVSAQSAPVVQVAASLPTPTRPALPRHTTSVSASTVPQAVDRGPSASPREAPAPEKSAPVSASTPQSRPTASQPSSCNPSFYFDAQGNKHFKPECFH